MKVWTCEFITQLFQLYLTGTKDDMKIPVAEFDSREHQS